MGTALQEYKQTVTKMIESKDLALPSHIAPEAFKNAAVVAYTDNPKIASCTPETVFRSLRRLAAMGLVPDGHEAALVPFKTKADGGWVDACQAMPMVAGLIKRARNSGEITDIRAHIVYQNEVDQGRFVYRTGDDEELTHDPILFGERGDPVGCYAIARLKDGSILRSFMSADDVDRVRRAGASQKIYKKGTPPVVSDEPIGIWKDWQEQMWSKTVIRRLCKRLSLQSEDRRYIQESDDEEFEMKDVTPTKPSLQERIDERNAKNDLAPEQEIIPPDAGFPGDPEWAEGAKAHDEGIGLDQNPYEGQQGASWAGGWEKASEA